MDLPFRKYRFLHVKLTLLVCRLQPQVGSGFSYNFPTQSLLITEKYKDCLVTTAHAAMVMTMNAENYNRLDQTIRKRCRNINGGNCRVALLDLQDAALYVKSSVPSNNLATENRVTQ